MIPPVFYLRGHLSYTQGQTRHPAILKQSIPRGIRIKVAKNAIPNVPKNNAKGSLINAQTKPDKIAPVSLKLKLISPNINANNKIISNISIPSFFR